MLFPDYGILSAIYVRILKLRTSLHRIMYGKAQNLYTAASVQLEIDCRLSISAKAVDTVSPYKLPAQYKTCSTEEALSIYNRSCELCKC